MKAGMLLALVLSFSSTGARAGDSSPWKQIRMEGEGGTVVEINYQTEVTSLSEEGDFTSARPLWINVSRPGSFGFGAVITNENPSGTLVLPSDRAELPLNLDRVAAGTSFYSGLVRTDDPSAPAGNLFDDGFENIGQTGHPPVHQTLQITDSTGTAQVFRFDLFTGKPLAN